MSNEADTCRKYVLPRLREAGWSDEQIREQFTFTAGQIMVSGGKTKRGKPKRADYLLRYKRDYHLAVVEAKADYRSALDGMQQAKDYAASLGLLFAYSTNGKEIVEFNGRCRSCSGCRMLHNACAWYGTSQPNQRLKQN